MNGTGDPSNLENKLLVRLTKLSFWFLGTDENGGEVRGGGMMLEVKQCPGRFLSIIGENHSVFKSNQLHVVIFRLFFIDLRYIP